MVRSEMLVPAVACVGLTLVVVVASSCQRTDATPPPETGAGSPVEHVAQPDPQVLGLLERPLHEVTVPFLMNEYGEASDTPCLQGVEELETGDANVSAHEAAKTHARGVTKVLRAWIAEKVAPAAVSESVIDTWEIVPESILSAGMGAAELRLVEDPGCISDETGLPEEGSRMVVELFGAKSFVFSAKAPLDRATADLLREQCEAEGLVFETDDLIDYELVTDEDGTPSKGSDGAKVYRSEEGGVQSEKTITLPEKQKLRSWTIAAPQPVFFGFRQASDEQWQVEFHEDRCDVNLVWGDPSFRKGRCSEYRGSGFAAVEKAGQVEVRVETGSDVHSEVMDYDETRRVRVDEQTILWLTPSRIEEGVLIRVNSVVLGSEP